MAIPPTANTASEAAPAWNRLKNERRSGEDGDWLLMCSSLSDRISKNCE
jgi:hypothetical protein